MYPQMTINNNLNLTKRLGVADSLEPEASRMFDRVFRSGRGLFSRKAPPLVSLAELQETHRTAGQYDRGGQTVGLDQIKGTLNKATDFDGEFHPIQRHSENRWVRVATAMLRGISLPPVELIQVGETYFVKDGHHRVSVARAMHLKYLDAMVTVWELVPRIVS